MPRILGGREGGWEGRKEESGRGKGRKWKGKGLGARNPAKGGDNETSAGEGGARREGVLFGRGEKEEGQNQKLIPPHHRVVRVMVGRKEFGRGEKEGGRGKEVWRGEGR